MTVVTRTAFSVRRPIPLFALAALVSVVSGLCIGAFPIGFGQILSAIGLSDVPLDDTTAAVLYAIRAPRVLAAFAVGAALAASGAAMQSLFRNPLGDPGLVGVSSGAALAAVSVIVLGERVMHIIPTDLRPWCLPVAAFFGGLAATVLVYRIAARDGVTLVGTLLLAGIAVNALTSAGIGVLVFVADDQQLRTLIFWTMGGFGAVTWTAILPAMLVLAISVPTLLPTAHLLDALALGEREAGHVGRGRDLGWRGLRRPAGAAHRAPDAGSGTSDLAARRGLVRRRLPGAGRCAGPHPGLAGGTADRRADGAGRRSVLPLAAGRPRRARWFMRGGL
jgi:iron complex transport system permease protein